MAIVTRKAPKLNRKAEKIYGKFTKELNNNSDISLQQAKIRFGEEKKAITEMIAKFNLITKGNIMTKAFKTRLQVKKVACIRAIMLENVHRLLTASEIVKIANTKYNNRSVKIHNVNSELNQNYKWYNREVCSNVIHKPYGYRVTTLQYKTVWHKVFLPESA